jgi:hypothetical protein
MLTTNLPDHVRQASSEEAVSVIHAPQSFASWVSAMVRIVHFIAPFDHWMLTPTDLHRVHCSAKPA